MVLGYRRATMFNTLLNMLGFYILLKIYDVEFSFFKIIFYVGVFTVYYVFNIYNLENGKYKIKDLSNSIIINGILSFIIFFTNFLSPARIFFWMILIQIVFKLFFYNIMLKNKNVIIVGKNDESKKIKEILNKRNLYNVVAELNFLEISKIEKIVFEKRVSKIIITEEIKRESDVIQILDLRLKGIKIMDYISFFEIVEEKILVNRIDEKWLLHENGFNILHDDFQKRLKRVCDFLLALLIGIGTFPIMIFTAIVVKLESPGPILFRQKRVGLANKEFMILKFRSMKIHDPEKHSKYAQKKDMRITKFGNIMRKTRIDELPQLWNVLVGEMSFVGPRAEWNELCYEYADEIPYYSIRHSVKPGLTGWAQVKYPYGVSVEDALRKLEYDLYYIKNQSFILDVVILFKTAKIVFFGKGM